jgi:acetyltransferase-like isoleucine patch superfamily enzyme
MIFFIRKNLEACRVMKRKVFQKLFDIVNPYPYAHHVITNKENVHIHPTAELKPFIVIQATRASVRIGQFSQINPFTVIYAGADITIGENVMVGPGCVFASGNHDFKTISQLPMRFLGSIKEEPIIIENDVWIGANCTLTAGVTIKTGTVIAANSVVTTDIESYSIAVGSPAKVI